MQYIRIVIHQDTESDESFILASIATDQSIKKKKQLKASSRRDTPILDKGAKAIRDNYRQSYQKDWFLICVEATNKNVTFQEPNWLRTSLGETQVAVGASGGFKIIADIPF